MAYWLMKSEPDELSIKGLEKLGEARWDGVRNYQARNFLRAMAVGDQFFFYHSSCPEPGIAGIGKIIEAAYPDPTALEPDSHYFDAKATPAQKALLGKLSPDQVTSTQLAGESIQQILSHAPGNNQAIGGLKVMTENGWFAARPSGTEDIYKIYAESFIGEDHLKQLVEEAQVLVDGAISAN